MGTDDSIQIIKNAIEELTDKHQDAWNRMDIKRAGRYWESAQTLRRFLDERVNNSRRQGVRQS